MFWLWKKLGAVPPEEMAGLELRMDGCWAITAPKWAPEIGFAAMPVLAGEGSTLYLEGGTHSDEVASFIEAHRVAACEKIARGTIWPRQNTVDLPATSEVVGEICAVRSGRLLRDALSCLAERIYHLR